ncbi:MAG: hypothetical protein CL685_02405 [Candidatus Magasanikbacteria bacterium]|nr:hypothetical protein [Candidatus Magasanikbacteria bacterium]|tara:strand:+ start:1481 stop:2467 length:987 start_codon:yes stop_codon:yes gene_type:complete
MKKIFLPISTLAALLLIGSGCIPSVEPTQDDIKENETIKQEELVLQESASLEVTDQEKKDNIVIIEKVVSSIDGWVVLYKENNGVPRNWIAYASITKGENIDVPVVLPPTESAEETYFALVHSDTNSRGKFDFPQHDAPIKNMKAVSFSTHKNDSAAEDEEIAEIKTETTKKEEENKDEEKTEEPSVTENVTIKADEVEVKKEEVVIEENNTEPTTPKTEEEKVEEKPKEVVAPAPEKKSFSITAKKWEFSPGIITVNKGDEVTLSITSVDVTHGFGLSAFNIKETLEPNKTTTVTFVADKSGSFPFFCSVFCGSGHGGMKGTLIVNE